MTFDDWRSRHQEQRATAGGAVPGSHAVVDHLVNVARPFIFDTGLAPPVADRLTQLGERR